MIIIEGWSIFNAPRANCPTDMKPTPGTSHDNAISDHPTPGLSAGSAADGADGGLLVVVCDGHMMRHILFIQVFSHRDTKPPRDFDRAVPP